MYVNGQQVTLYLGEDRRLYINQTPGKSLCEMIGRIFLNAQNGQNVISITKIPEKFDGGKIYPPTGYIIQGLD